MKGKIYIVIASVLLGLFVQSCKVGPKYSEPIIQAPTHYRADSLNTDSLLNLRWWELFGDEELKQLVEIGLRSNKDLLVAVSRIQQAEYLLGIARADYGPKFGIQAGASRGNFFGNNTMASESNNFNFGGTLSWEIDFWGKFRRLGEAAQAELMASEYGLRAIQISLISQIASAYFQLLDFTWRYEISQNTLRTRSEALVLIQAKFNQGYTPEIDVNQAQIQLAIAQAAVPTFERAIVQTENALSVLLGRNPASVSALVRLENVANPPNIPQGIPSQLLVRRPDILQSEQFLIAQNAQIGVAQAARFPSISLTGLLGLGSPDLSDLNMNGLGWNIAGGLFMPLFEWNKNKRRVQLERARTTQALLEYEQTILLAFQEVEDALIGVKTFKEELDARNLEVTAAKNARMLSQERYDKGVTSFLEVLEQERAAFNAELNYAAAKRSVLESYIQLYKSLGGGWLSEQEEQAAQAAEASGQP